MTIGGRSGREKADQSVASCPPADRMLTRRAFIGTMAAAVATPRPAATQNGARVRRIGVLVPYTETTILGEDVIGLLRLQLKEKGWIDGQNIQINARRQLSDPSRIRTEAQTLVKWSPDVIFCANALLLSAAQRQTRTIPIVFVQVADPVGQHFVNSMERPGGNVTGVANYDFGMAGRWLEVLSDIVPGLSRVALIYNVDSALANRYFVRTFEAAARPLNLRLDAASAATVDDIKATITALGRERGGAFVVLPEPFSTANRAKIIALAEGNKVPGLYPFRHFVVAGGLCSYGVNVAQAYQTGAGYIDRILNGDSPAELPIFHPKEFELVINARTAKAIGLEIPPAIVARADEVIG